MALVQDRKTIGGVAGDSKQINYRGSTVEKALDRFIVVRTTYPTKTDTTLVPLPSGWTIDNSLIVSANCLNGNEQKVQLGLGLFGDNNPVRQIVYISSDNKLGLHVASDNFYDAYKGKPVEVLLYKIGD